MSGETRAHEDATSRNLSLMAAAAAHLKSAAGDGPGADGALSPARRSRLVLPILTPAMQHDLALAKTSPRQAAKPLAIGTRPEYADYALQGIATPHPNDVLCGRGGGSNNHPGNESFRELVNEVKFPYVHCPKREKPLIARRIVEAVRRQTPPGRFLAKASATGLWHDIGDGKAREKTSQALREGAPILRRDVSGPPPATDDAAGAVPAARRAERAEQERGRGRPERAAEECDAAASRRAAHLHGESPASAQHAQAAPSLPTNGSIVMQRGATVDHSPPVLPIKRFRSFGEPNGPRPQAPWPPMPPHQQQPGRNVNLMPYGHQRSPLMGGYAAPSLRGPVDYAHGGLPRVHGGPGPHAAVPLDTVRRLLLGQLDPVQLALRLLPPEEAAYVARRHALAAGPALSRLRPAGGGLPPPPPPGRGGPAALAAAPHQYRLPLPLPLHPLVSDGSASDSTQQQKMGVVRRGPCEPSAALSCGHSDVSGGGGGGDDGSSVESKHSHNSERALPKKKRKYVAM